MIVNQTCLICQDYLHYDLSWKDILKFGQIEVPEICQDCLDQLQALSQGDTHCYACNRPLNESTDDLFHKIYIKDNQSYCLDCYRWLAKYPIDFVRHHSLITYNSFIQDWLYRYKYQGDHRLASLTKDLLIEAYKHFKEAAWLVLPSSPKSLKTRGFHPTSLILEKAGIPYSLPFKYVGDGKRQAEKNRQDRIKLVQPFEILPDKLIDSTYYLIFDDVYTTGATLLAAKTCLYQYLFQRVGKDRIKISSLSIARDY